MSTDNVKKKETRMNCRHQTTFPISLRQPPKHKRKKIRKKRGTKWHGYGAKKKHRGKGSHGGKGNAGLHKFRFSYVTTKDREHYGYKGFSALAKKRKAVNLYDLESSKKSVFSFGRDVKVLGDGELSRPIKLRAFSISKSAKAKIKAAGGSVVLAEEFGKTAAGMKQASEKN